MTGVGAILLAGLLIVLGVLIFNSRGTPLPYRDADGRPLAGSLSEKIFIDVNGVRQGMFIKSKNLSNPVLLYLHGGMPDYFLDEKYPSGLDEDFTVVWWEQRGSGLSYSPDIPRATLTAEQMIADTLTVTQYLRQRFGQDKIYLMGHSGGTFIGLQVVARFPQFYSAYIGEAQMTYQLQSEVLAYDAMLARFKEQGDSQMVRKLEAAPVTLASGTPPAYIAIRDSAMHRLGIGTMRAMDSVITGIFLPSLACQDYTLLEKYNLWHGKAQSGVSVVWDSMLTTDLRKSITRIEIPVYFFHGVHDYTVSYSLARDYFTQLATPLKGFYTFSQSAHSPMFEEPAKMDQIMRDDVLKGKNSLADLQ